MKSGHLRRGTCALALLLLISLLASPLYARTHRRKRKSLKQGKPVVQQVSPPNWWSGLPDPMLLLKGKNLVGARFSSSVAGISVRRIRISKNGHWAFVWLDISGAPPQQFKLLARTSSGKVEVSYGLEKRHDPEEGFHGFSPSDVLYRMDTTGSAGTAISNATIPNASVHAHDLDNLSVIQSHLEDIQQLGVTTIELGPLYLKGSENEARDREVANAVDMYHIDPKLGTLDEYESLAKAMHSRNLKLILDMSLNNVGLDSPWVLDPPTSDWFHGTVTHHLAASNDFSPVIDPHAPPAAYQNVVDGWIRDTQPDLNQSNPLVRDYLVQNALWWIESGTLDGIRFEDFPYVNRTFWQHLSSVLEALYPHLTTVGNIASSDPAVVSYFVGGVRRNGIDTGLYTAIDVPTAVAFHAVLAGGARNENAPMATLESVQRLDWLYPHPERLVLSLENERPGATETRLKLALGLLATMRGIPEINSSDVVAAPASQSETGENQIGYTNPAGHIAAQSSLRDWMRGLLKLRAQNAVLENGAQQNLFADDTGFVFARIAAPPSGRAIPSIAHGEILLVLVNKSNQPRTFHLDFSHTALQGVRALLPEWNTKEQEAVTHNRCDIQVAAEQLVVFSVQREVSAKSAPFGRPGSPAPQSR